MKLSIIIPVFNEKESLLKILKKVEEADTCGLTKEIILVDDCSTDGTRDILKAIHHHKIIYHDKNAGKGAAVRTGLENCTGDILLIQDADLEYDPDDYPALLRPILDGRSEVVYGSRFHSKQGHLKQSHITYFIHLAGNTLLTLLTNILFFAKLTDMETCYKVFSRNAFNRLGKLRARRFDFEPEITAKFLKRGFRIMEVPIHYYSRDFHEGKKITWKDGFKAVWYLMRYRFSD